MGTITSEWPLPMEMFARRAREKADQVYLRQPIDRVYNEITWAEAYDQTRRLASGLLSLGLQPGDKVAILSENCAEWFISDFAITMAGLISVPIYFTAGEKTIRYVLEHSEAKAIIVGKLTNYQAAQQAIEDDFLTIGMPYDTLSCKQELTQLVADSEPLPESAMASPDLGDMFSITYTSGSTGNPKGVVLTFKNIVYGGSSTANLMEGNHEERVISYLPLAHITERSLIEYASLYAGAQVTFVESLQTFVDDLKSARATFFLSVPRLWMKFQSGVLAKMPQKKLNRLLKIPVVNSMVRRKIKEQLGLSYVRNCGSGSAPISPAILDWYHRLGIEISEGWGMTELTGMATTQFPFRPDKIGTIGRAMDGLEVKTSEQGEIQVRGDAVFKEYYKNPEVTSETFTDDGFMRTGDKAEMDEEGYLRITGRVKDLFKSGKGKYVAPVPIESKLAVNQLIEQLCVMGSGLPQPVAVVVLSQEVAEGMSKEEISASLAETLESVNAQLEKHEVLGGIRIAAEPWTIDNGLLTPTLKIKRAELEEKYGNLIAESSQKVVVWE